MQKNALKLGLVSYYIKLSTDSKSNSNKTTELSDRDYGLCGDMTSELVNQCLLPILS